MVWSDFLPLHLLPIISTSGNLAVSAFAAELSTDRLKNTVSQLLGGNLLLLQYVKVRSRDPEDPLDF